MNKIILFTLALIVVGAFFLRVYKLTEVPPSLNWDETAAAYNAYTIRNWLKDEYGNFMPLVFRSFGDDKHPVHIYATAIVYLFGVTDFTTRLPSVLIGTAAVTAMFFIGKFLFKSAWVGLIASTLLAASSYHIHYSRGLWEANFAVSLFIIGLALFAIGLEKKNYLLTLGFVGFGLSFLSYHSSKIVVPPLVFLLCVLYLKQLITTKKYFYVGFGIFIAFLSLLVVEPRLTGLERARQTKLDPVLVQSTYIFQKTQSELLGRGEVAAGYYKNYFSYDYLFKTGDQEPRGSAKIGGQFYKLHLVLFPFGFIFLLIKKQFKLALILLAWLTLAPIPAALAGANPNSTRAIFMLGGVELVSAYGAGSVIALFKKEYLKYLAFAVVGLFISLETYPFYTSYLANYPRNEAIQWQYGMREVAEYIKDNPNYTKVYVTKIRSQPYIFFLYYFRTSLPKLLATVRYDESSSKSYNTVESFGKYNFGNWDVIESEPVDGYLYVVTQNEFEGFRKRDSFVVNKVVNFPGGDLAFYLVSNGYEQK